MVPIERGGVRVQIHAYVVSKTVYCPLLHVLGVRVLLLMTSSLLMLSSRYVRYRQKPMSITDILSLTLSFVRDERTWEEEEEEGEGEGEGPRGEEQAAEKRARTSLHPSPRYKSESELHTLEQCLTRWTQELAQDMEGMYVQCSNTF